LQQQTQQQKQELGLAHHRLPAAAVSLHQIPSPEQATKTLNRKTTKAGKKTTTAASKQASRRVSVKRGEERRSWELGMPHHSSRRRRNYIF